MEQTNKRAKYESSYKCASYINLSLVAKRRISDFYPDTNVSKSLLLLNYHLKKVMF
jgi:hypothetical protein